jgi:hypothetical protein
MLRSNDSRNMRPYFFDHTVTTGLVAAAWGVSVGRTAKAGLGGFIIGTLTLGPMSYWLYLNGRTGAGGKPAKIWYEDGVSKEDIARYQALDQEEILANEMMRRPGYGLV